MSDSDYLLHYMPTTASLSVHWVLTFLSQTANVEYSTNVISFPSSAQKSDSYLQLNPKGRVPTLIISPTSDTPIILTESVAILLYLADSHPTTHLAPPTSDIVRRVKYLETMVFIANTLLPCLRDYIYAEKDGQPQFAEGVKVLATTRRNDAWDLLDGQLEGKRYLVGGGEPTVADFLLVSLTGWMGWLNDEACERANLRALVERMKERDDWKEVRAKEEQVEAKL